MSVSTHALTRRGLAAVLALTVVVLTAAPAAAHVTVKSTEATQGGFAKLSVRVPTESETASTTKVQLALPREHPFAFVSIKPSPGWTATTKKEKLPEPVKVGDQEIAEAITEITWVASAGSGVKPGEFQEFDISVGPLPEVESVTFKAIQTYSDGKVIRWIEERTEGGEEPEFPAPELALAAGGGGHGAAAASSDEADTADTAAGDDGGSGVALALGVAGLVTGLAGLALGALAFVSTRRRTRQTAVAQPA